MGQKTIWIQLLIIGTLNSFQSCELTQVEPTIVDEYYYINNSGYDIAIKTFDVIDTIIFRNEFIIQNDSTLFQNTTESGDIIFGTDSIVINFDGIRQASFVSWDTTSSFNIISGTNYEWTKIKKNWYKHTYTFTEEDFENAIPIE